jgi:hypothetical protein
MLISALSVGCNFNLTPKYRYFLGTFDKPTIRDEFNISEADYLYCSDILDRFLKLSSEENLFRVVDFNYNDFESKVNSYLTKNYQLNFYEFDYLFVDMNRLILNLLSSIRTYLDHTETRLKRDYGEEEYLLFKEETSKAYDNSLEYRFLYKLRNYAQHCGLPAGSAEVTSFQDENLIWRDKMNVFFVRDQLINKYDGWSNLVKTDLQAMPENFDVLPLVNKMYDLLKNINEKLKNKIRERYKQDAQFLFSLLPRLTHLAGIPCLIKMEETDVIKVTFKSFPFEHISQITGATINFKYIEPNQ